jgi:hypothetical protein
MSEVVYVLGAPGINTVKIGRTTNLAKRVADIQRMSPVLLAVLWTHPGGSELEARLHRHFAARRAHGEWFTFDDDPLPAVKEAVAKALQPAPALPSPRSALDEAEAQRLLDLVAEDSELHRTKRAELEQTIAEARRAGCSLTLISEHVPFSREWIRQMVEKADQEDQVAAPISRLPK